MDKFNSNKIKLRQLTLADYNQLVALHKQCFPAMLPWKKEQIESQMNIFPEGQICLEYEGKLIASSNSLITTLDLNQDHLWGEATDQGYIRNHNPKGETLYGMEIMVHPQFQKKGLATQLYNARKDLVKKYSLKQLAIAGRMPGYGVLKEELSPEEYVEEVVQKRRIDPVLTPQLTNGFQVRRILPNYFPLDKESLGYAVLMIWESQSE